MRSLARSWSVHRSGVQLGVGVVTGVLAGVEVLGGVKVASRSRAVNCGLHVNIG